MVPPSSRADAEAAAASPDAAWLARLRAILDVNRGGLVVLLSGAHPAAVKPLVETLLEGYAPEDPEAPLVTVCFNPREMQDAPVGATVVLVGAEREPEWLNLFRPVVRERSLVVLLWVTDGGLEPLRRNAPDFMDWVSHRIEVPWFAPEGAVAELERALARVKWVAVAGAELVSVAAKERLMLDADLHYDDLASAMDGSDVMVRGVERDDQLWRLMLAHAELRWNHRVVLAEPKVLPPFVEFIDTRIEDWEQCAGRLESLGLEHARLVAAIECTKNRNMELPPASALAIDEAHMELLGRVAGERLDDISVRLARDLGLDDVALSLESTIWLVGDLSPEMIERGLHGGLRERRVFADYLTSVAEREAIDVLAINEDPLSSLPEIVQDVIEEFYPVDGGQLRASTLTTGPAIEEHARRIAEARTKAARHTRSHVIFEHSRSSEVEQARHNEFLSKLKATLPSLKIIPTDDPVVSRRTRRVMRRFRAFIERASSHPRTTVHEPSKRRTQPEAASSSTSRDPRKPSP